MFLNALFQFSCEHTKWKVKKNTFLCSDKSFPLFRMQIRFWRILSHEKFKNLDIFMLEMFFFWRNKISVTISSSHVAFFSLAFETIDDSYYILKASIRTTASLFFVVSASSNLYKSIVPHTRVWVEIYIKVNKFHITCEGKKTPKSIGFPR